MYYLYSSITAKQVLPLLLLAGVVACGESTNEEPTIASTSQQMRAGVGDEGEALVGVDVLVTDEEGEGVPCGEGTVEMDIEISRNGPGGPWVLVDHSEIDNSCSEEIGGDLALVFDNSASVSEQLDQLKGAVARASDRIVEDGGRVSLIRASTESRVLSDLTDDLPALGEAIDSMWISNGWSALWDGVRMGNESFGEEGDESATQRFDGAESFCASNRKRGILLFTDGEENNSSHQKLRSEDYPGDGIDTLFEDLISLKVGADATPIYTVGLGDDVDAEAMEGLAESTGGRYIHLESLDSLEPVLESVSQYFGASRRFCSEIPSHLCGSLDVRVTHRWTDGVETTEGVRVQHVDIPCDARAQGRVATILLTLAATETTDEVVDTLVANTVNWVSPVDAPNVLFVLDDAHHNEFSNDPAELFMRFTTAGYRASYLDEPGNGLTLEALEGFDVVWFSNPGHPMDDQATFNALRQFSEAGGGVVLQGDDMSSSLGRGFELTPLNQLEHVDNGIRYCGRNVDNGKGDKYTVTLGTEEHPILAGIAGASFLYGDDIDTARLASDSAQVLGTATVERKRKSCDDKPVIVVHSPAEG